MKKLIACFLVLPLLLISCATVTTVGRERGFGFPTQTYGVEVEILEKSGGCVNGELISVEKNIILPTPAGPEPVVRVDIGDATRLWVFLIISTELQALIEAIISIPPIF